MNTRPTAPEQRLDLPGFLAKWPWFRALPVELRALTLETVTERVASAGEYIAHAGDPSTHWYGVVRGYLQMYVVGPDGAETTLYCLPEGEWGGDGSLLKKEILQYDLRALTPAHICLMPAQTFETLRRSSFEFNHFLCDTMNARMGVFVGMLVASRLLGPEVRVARALLMLADTKRDDSQELAISQHEIALISGLSRQRVNVALSVFTQRGFVQTEARKGHLVVHVSQLRRYVIAGGESTSSALETP
jgi:CRP/FNR family transcriptional regulator, cyclic AMP receptor protein